MSPVLTAWKVVVGCVVIFLVGLPTSANRLLFSAESEPPRSCAAPEFRAFDFWIGDWEAFDIDKPNTKVAHNRVDRILDGCVLLEDYQATDGSHGESFTIYDASRKVWHQSWVTNHGALLIIEGNMQSGDMVLSGTDRTADGKQKRVRGTWKPVPGGVRETAVTSTDDGKTWKPWFDLIFRPAATSGAARSAGGDEALVAALDTQYQAAVKNNDATVMGQILADDFVLVIGSGKTFSKADLLKEAESKQFVYEHQEDTEQTVRVWGDSAVVTAKLWGKGTNNGKPFDHTLWFSDTYVRTPTGWRYVFGQASLPLPSPSPAAATGK